MPVQIPLIKSFITRQFGTITGNCLVFNPWMQTMPMSHIFCIFITNPLINTPVLIFFGHLTLCPIEDGKYVLFFVYGVNSPCSDKLHLGFLADSFSQRCVLPVTLYHFWVDGLLEYLVSTFVVGFSPLINFSSLNS